MLRTGGGEPVRPDLVVPAPGVHDAVFAYLIGLVDGDLYGTIDETTLEQAVRQASGSSALPYRYLDTMTRVKEPGRITSRIEIGFREELEVPIPYRILGYAPGDLRASREVGLREWNLGTLVLRHKDDTGTIDVRLEDIHLYGVTSGLLWVDIDGWLDRLVGGKLDDTRITGLVLFRYQGERWGLAVGYNRDWKGRSGLLSFRENEIRFPSPAPLKSAAWRMRQTLEGLEPSLRPDSLRARSAD